MKRADSQPQLRHSERRGDLDSFEDAAQSRAAMLATAAVATVLVLTTLGFDTSLKEPYRAPKLWVLMFGGSALLALSWLTPGSWQERWERLRPALTALAPLCAIAALSIVGSQEKSLSLEAVAALFGGVALVFAGVLMPVRYRWLFRVLQALALLISCWLLWDWLQMRAAPPQFRARFELRASLGNPADVSIFLLVPCLLFQHQLHRLRRAFRRGEERPSTTRWLWLLSAAVLTHAAVLLTQTLSATLALLVGSAVLVPRMRTWRARIGVLGLASAMAAAIWFSPVRERAVDKLAQLRAGEINAFLTGRLDGWIVAWELAKQNPLRGAGLGVFGQHFNAEKERLIGQGVEFFAGHEVHSSFGNAHNELLEVFAELGVAGLLSVAWLVVVVVRRLVLLAPAQWRFGLAVLAATTVISLSYFPFRTAATAIPILLVLSWALAVPVRGAASKAPAGASPDPGRWKIGAAALVATLLLCWAPLIRIVEPAVRAERALWVAESQAPLLGDVTSASQRRSWEAMRRALEAAFAQRSYDARLPLTIGSYWMLANEPEQARRWYERSLAIEVRPETILNLARAQRALGMEKEALLSEERLLALDPFRRRQLRPPGGARPPSSAESN